MVPKMFSLAMTELDLAIQQSSGTPCVVSWWGGLTNFNHSESNVGTPLGGPREVQQHRPQFKFWTHFRRNK